MDDIKNYEVIKKRLDSTPEILINNQNYEDEILLDWNLLNESNFKKMLRYHSSVVNAPTEFLTTNLLAAISGAAGKHFYFRITDSFNIYLNVWSCIVAPSSILRKTTSINEITKDVKRISIKNYNDFKKELDEYNSELNASENKKTFNKPKPIRKYLVFPEDSTLEKFGEILSTSERGMFIYSELATFLSQLERGYSSDAKSTLTAMYDVPISFEISRMTRENILIERPFFSLAAATTIDWLISHSSKEDLRTGFFQRFIFSIRNKPNEDSKNIPLLELKNLTSRSEFYFDSRSIYDWLISFKEPTELVLTEAARKIHIEYDNDNYKEMLNYNNESELSFSSRLLIYCLKFSGLIALSDKRFEITQEDMKDAVLLTEYYKLNMKKLLNQEIIKTEFTRNEEKILGLLKSKGNEMQRSHLLRHSHLTKKEFDDLIINLESKELIESFQRKAAGKSKASLFYRIKE